MAATDRVVIERPNRRKGSSRTTKALVVLLLLVPVQALLVVAAMQGFRQAWNVEVERRPDARGRRAPATR